MILRVLTYRLILISFPLAHGDCPFPRPKVRMTRYGGMGRTRPKKLTSKASIPIVREQDIDIIDDEVQNALQQVETGVEKAEESVSSYHPPPKKPQAPSLYPSRDIIPNLTSS